MDDVPSDSNVKTISRPVPHHYTWVIVKVVPSFAIVLSLFALFLRIRQGLSVLEYPDEAEQFVAADMLLNGHHLYGDLFEHHGPLPYFITYLYARFVSSTDFSEIRLFQVALALASGLAVFLAPVLRTGSQRVLAACLYILMLASVWNVDSFNLLVNYKISSLLFVILACQFSVPGLLGIMPGYAGSFVAGAAASACLLCAFTNAPAILLFIAVPLQTLLGAGRRAALRMWGCFLLGSFLVGAGLLSWLLGHGDIPGYFVLHIWFNEHIFQHFQKYSLAQTLSNFWVAFDQQSVTHAASVALFFGWVYFFLAILRGPEHRASRSSPVAPLTLMALAVTSANLRGYNGIADSGFASLNFALFSIASTIASRREHRGKSYRGVVLSVMLSALLLIYGAASSALSFFGIKQQQFPEYLSLLSVSHEPIYDFVRSITRKDGDLLVLTNNPVIYLRADRLPASGNLFYHPWQAEYNRSPQLGYRFDLCGDIEQRRPAVIWFFNWRLGDEYSIDDFEPCVISLIAHSYRSLQFDAPWFIRADIYPSVIGKAPMLVDPLLDYLPDGWNVERAKQPIMKTSNELGPHDPIEIKIDPHHKRRQLGLAKIRILFSAPGRRTHGTAELVLTDSEGTEIRRPFSLDRMLDNQYKAFDLDGGQYVSGRIISSSGAGIRTWESDLNHEYTCLIFEYTNEIRKYTPACPIM